MSDNVMVTTKPERLLVPADHAGAVSRGGKNPVVMDAKDWLPGDVVDTMVNVRGRPEPVRFTVGTVEAAE